MPCFNHAMIVSPSFHSLRKECLAQWPAFCALKSEQKLQGGYFQKNWEDCAACFLKPLPYFRPKSVIFPTHCFRPDQNFDTLFPGARRVTRARDKLLRHVHGSWHKRKKREMVLSPNDEEVANSSKKHTQSKIRVYKPYPISDQNGRNWYPISDQNG